MTDQHTIRPATNADAGAVRDLVFGVLAEYGLAADPAVTDADLANLESAYLMRGGIFDVLTGPDGTIRGTVGLFPLEENRCELRKMYLSSLVRGRGLGRQLLAHALRRASELGFHRVELETAGVLKEAISLYTAAGFRPFTPPHMSPRCDQAYYLELAPTKT